MENENFLDIILCIIYTIKKEFSSFIQFHTLLKRKKSDNDQTCICKFVVKKSQSLNQDNTNQDNILDCCISQSNNRLNCLNNFDNVSGLYLFFSQEGNVLYIGEAGTKHGLKGRLQKHFNGDISSSNFAKKLLIETNKEKYLSSLKELINNNNNNNNYSNNSNSNDSCDFDFTNGNNRDLRKIFCENVAYIALFGLKDEVPSNKRKCIEKYLVLKYKPIFNNV